MRILWIFLVLAIKIEFILSVLECMEEHETFKELVIQCPPCFSHENCTAIRINLRKNQNFLSINCINIEYFHTNLLPNLTKDFIDELEINFCPYESLKKIYDHFELLQIEVFTYENSDNFSLNRNCFRNLVYLKKLKLRFLNFAAIDENFFYYTPRLTSLVLEHNKNLILVSKIFQNLSQLKVLHLSNNSLEEIPNGLFINLSRLESLHLYSNFLTKIEENTFRGLRKLKSLELCANAITYIADNAFDSLEELTAINLSINNLTFLSANIFEKNKKIQKIYLGLNKFLTLLDYTFANLPSLEELDLSMCNLQQISDNLFENTTNLKELELNGNKIKNLSSNIFKGLKNLIKIDLSENLLENIDKDLFKNLNKLEEIYLQENRIGKIYPEIFFNNNNLKIINLSNNKFSGDLCHFKKLTNLESLDLSYNLIKDIDLLSLRNLGRLTELDLSSNLITSIKLQDRSFAQYRSFRYSRISLKRNPIHCDCNALPLVLHLKNQYNFQNEAKFEFSIQDLTCASPLELKEVQLTSVQLSQLTCFENDWCPDNCTCIWRPIDANIIINCSKKFFFDYPKFTIFSTHPYNEIELHLEDNFLSVGPSENLTSYKNVTKLFLSNNYIKKLYRFPSKFKVLTLDHNNLTHLDGEILELLNGTNLTLGYNYWSCGCESTEFSNFLRTHSKMVFDNNEVVCLKNKSQLLINLDKYQICFRWDILYYGVSALVLLVVIIIALLVALFYRYQHDIKVWLFANNLCLFLFLEETCDINKMYDVFISYSEKDQDFVMQNLLPVLEDECCKTSLALRDSTPGEIQIIEVTKLISTSRRTIIVLSKNFLESVWTKLEFQTAFSQAMTEDKTNIIIVLYGVIEIDNLNNELKTYLKMNTYVKWGERYFWNKLKYALPHKNYISKNKQTIVDTMNCIDHEFNLSKLEKKC